MLQKILIATGDSPESAEIFKSGLTLAEKYGAEILILYVLNLFQSEIFLGSTNNYVLHHAPCSAMVIQHQ